VRIPLLQDRQEERNDRKIVKMFFLGAQVIVKNLVATIMLLSRICHHSEIVKIAAGM
jgi:hypothetical protein